jgi:flavin-binding protein dodecin
MTVAKVTEIKVSSPKSFDDAIQEGITRANKTLKNVKSAWVKDFEVIIDDKGQISEYRVLMKVTFILVS